jgi:hypothetical protein
MGKQTLGESYLESNWWNYSQHLLSGSDNFTIKIVDTARDMEAYEIKKRGDNKTRINSVDVSFNKTNGAVFYIVEEISGKRKIYTLSNLEHLFNSSNSNNKFAEEMKEIKTLVSKFRESQGSNNL